MANELTRKGIAFGAAVALGSTLIVGGVANAADTNNQDLTLGISGTSNGAFATTSEDDFRLKLTMNGDVDRDQLDLLKYKVTLTSDTEDNLTGYVSTNYIYWDENEDAAVVSTNLDEDGSGYGSDMDTWTTVTDTTDTTGQTVVSSPWAINTYDNLARWDWTVYDDHLDETGICANGSGWFDWVNPAADYLEESDGTRINDTRVDLEDYCVTGDISGDVPSDNDLLVFSNPRGATGDINYVYDGADEIYVDLGLVDGNVPNEKADFTVQAFISADDTLDAGEAFSAPVTVTFWNGEALTPVLTLEDDGVAFEEDAAGEDGFGEGEIGYEVTFAEPLNDRWTEDYSGGTSAFGEYTLQAYVDGDEDDEDGLEFEWTKNAGEDGNELSETGSIGYDVTDGVEDLGSSVTRVRVEVYNDKTQEWSYTAWQNITVKQTSVDYVDNFVTEQDYVIASSSEDAIIRDDVNTVEYNVEFWHEDGEDDVTVAGVDGTVYVQSDYFYTDVEDTGEDHAAAWFDDYGIEIGEAEAELIYVDAVTDYWYYEWAVEGTSNADGVMSFDINVENPDENLYLYVDYVDYEGTGEELAGDLYWDPTSYYVDFQGSFGNGFEDEEGYDNATAAVGDSFDFEAYITDQWGHPLDGGEVRVYSEDRGGWDEKDFAVKDGVAALKVTDGAAADGEEFDAYYDLDLIVDGEDLSFDGDEDFEIDWLTEQAEAGYVTADWEDDGLANVSYYDFVTGNYELEWRELDANDMYNDAYSYGDGEWLEILVHGPDGYRQGGQHFTVSGAGLYFLDYDEDEAKSGVGSVSGMTDHDGSAWVWVQGHTVGEHTITVTANGKSTTVDLTVLDEALYGSAVSVAPFTGKAGTAETISATVTDKFGNKVPDAVVSFSAVGGGYFNDATGTTGGDADDSLEDVATAGYGVATSQLIIQSGEVGYGTTVTATIDVVDPLGVEEDTTASASLAAGATDFGKPAFWTKDLGDGTLKLYAKNIVGAGKIQFFHNGKEIAWIKAVDALDPKLRAANGSYYLVRTVKLVSGKNVLEIKDDGVRVVRRVASK